MDPETVIVKVNRTPEALAKKKSFKGYIENQKVMSPDEVCREAERKSMYNAAMLRHAVEDVLESAIKGIEEDGRTRQIGEYFSLALGVRGAFDSKGDKFKDYRNEIVLHLLPLKRFRKFRPRFNVRVDNAGPLVELRRLRSVSAPDSERLVWGDELVLTGKNLNYLPGDEVHLTVLDDFAPSWRTSVQLSDRDVTVTHDGTQMNIKWPDWGPTYVKTRPYKLELELRSRGGVADADRQIHQIHSPL